LQCPFCDIQGLGVFWFAFKILKISLNCIEFFYHFFFFCFTKAQKSGFCELLRNFCKGIFVLSTFFAQADFCLSLVLFRLLSLYKPSSSSRAVNFCSVTKVVFPIFCRFRSFLQARCLPVSRLYGLFAEKTYKVAIAQSLRLYKAVILH
jgi:hypothetical protein